jgi:hypothetical protein
MLLDSVEPPLNIVCQSSTEMPLSSQPMSGEYTYDRMNADTIFTLSLLLAGERVKKFQVRPRPELTKKC